MVDPQSPLPRNIENKSKPVIAARFSRLYYPVVSDLRNKIECDSFSGSLPNVQRGRDAYLKIAIYSLRALDELIVFWPAEENETWLTYANSKVASPDLPDPELEGADSSSVSKTAIPLFLLLINTHKGVRTLQSDSLTIASRIMSGRYRRTSA